VLGRIRDDTPDKAWRAWTYPEVLKQWFAPAPYTHPRLRLDFWPVGPT